MLNENEMAVKNCSAAYPRYYAVTIDPVTGSEIGRREITASEYADYSGNGTGCPDASAEGMPLGARPVFGGTFRRRVVQDARKMGLNAEQVKKVESIAFLRPMLLMQLRNEGVPVPNPNNFMQILAIYGRQHPQLPTPSNDLLRGSTKPGSMNTKSFDWGGAIGGLVGIVGGIVDAVNEGNVDSTLATWATNFTNYMQTDFAVIRNKLASEGPQAALNAFNGYYNGSWAEMKAAVQQLCQAHNKPIPAAYQVGWQQQDALKSEILALIPPNSGNTNGNNNGGNRPNTGNNTGNIVSGAIPAWGWIVIVVVGVLGIVGVIAAVTKK